MKPGNKPKPFEQRYVIDAATGCWNWTSSTNSHGYGAIKIDGVQLAAHRVSWERKFGPIAHDGSAHGICVLHKCDNRLCVNPDHLSLGTAGDNNRDRTQKGRSAKGERHHQAKLSENDIRAIRSDSERADVLARRYGVATSTVRRIRTGRIWKHL